MVCMFIVFSTVKINHIKRRYNCACKKKTTWESKCKRKKQEKKGRVGFEKLIRNVSWLFVTWCMNEFILGIDKMLSMQHELGKTILDGNISHLLVFVTCFFAVVVVVIVIFVMKNYLKIERAKIIIKKKLTLYA